MTTTTLRRWGNSQGIRIPKHILKKINWNDDENIVIKTEDDKIVLERDTRNNKKKIVELFEGYTGEYQKEEINWGKVVGKELW